MATRVRNYQRQNRSGPDGIYDWDTILDGRNTYLLEAGSDYSCQTKSMVTLVKREARKRKLRVSIFLWYGDGQDQFKTTRTGKRVRNKPRGLTVVNRGALDKKPRF